MDSDVRTADCREKPKRWEKPVVADVSLESDEDVLGNCYSPSTPGSSGPGGPITVCP